MVGVYFLACEGCEEATTDWNGTCDSSVFTDGQRARNVVSELVYSRRRSVHLSSRGQLVIHVLLQQQTTRRRRQRL